MFGLQNKPNIAPLAFFERIWSWSIIPTVGVDLYARYLCSRAHSAGPSARATIWYLVYKGSTKNLIAYGGNLPLLHITSGYALAINKLNIFVMLKLVL